MQAILLVGGFGTRLRPLTLTRPKQMLPVLHRPMIEHVVAALGRHGIERVVLALGYQDDVFRHAYPDERCAGVELCCTVEPEPLDTAGAIRFAYEASRMSRSDGTFLAANGDVITDVDIGAMLQTHKSAAREATIHLIEVPDPSRFGVVVFDDFRRVSAFVEKPQGPEPPPSQWINAGTYLMEPSVIERIEPARRVSIERQVFPALARSGTLGAFPQSCYWVDAGTPESYLQVQLDLLDRKADIAPQASSLPGTTGVTVTTGVSPEAVVAASAAIERSVVMADARVASRCVVKGSVLHSGVELSPEVTVLDSIVGERAKLAKGCRVTNGSVVGDGALVDAGEVLSAARVVPSR